MTNLLTTDLRNALRWVKTDTAGSPTELAGAMGINHRYARELLGLLQHQGLIEFRNLSDDWRITQLGLDTLAKRVIESTDTATKPTKENTMPNTKTTKAPEFRKCGCGCGADVAGKTQFRQGHDARMISQLVALVVGQDAGSRRNKQAKPVAPAAFTKIQADHANGGADIQDRINSAANAVAKAHGDKLARKAHDAMMNGWQRENDRNTKPARKAAAPAKTVTAKVGRWTKEGVIKGGKLHTTDAKGNAQVIDKGKFTVLA